MPFREVVPPCQSRSGVAARRREPAERRSAAAPTLIGDTISFLRAYPDRTTQFGNAIPDTTVVAGSADVVGWSFGAGPVSATFDPEADSILLSITTTTGFVNSNSQFDGFVISGIDADLVAASVLSNNTLYSVGLDVDSSHSLVIGLNSIGFSSPGSILIDLQFRDTAVPSVTGVPEPTSAALAAAAMGMLALRRTRRARAEEGDRQG